MRILIITEYLPETEEAEITGGVEAYCHYVAAHLSREHDVEVISRPSQGSVWDDASIRSLPGRVWFLLGAFVRGVRAPADVVIGTTYVVQPVAWIVAKLRRRPVVFWYPDVLIGSWRDGGFGRVAGTIGQLVERVLVRLPVDHFIAISESTAGKLVANGVPRERISVVPCGYEPALVDATVAEPDGAHRIVVVGRLVPYKRVDVVVRALALLHERHPDLRLVVIGQGPELEGLRGLAAELGVADRVELRGFVARHADVLATLAGSAALVSASEIEGFGIVVVEAMALGVPYVVSDIPAFREVTGGGKGGRLFEPGCPDALATALEEVLDAPLERNERARDGIAQAAPFQWSAIATRTAKVLADTVAADGRRAGGMSR